MTEDRDPGLETLFAAAGQELSAEEFTATVTSRARSRGRSVFAGRLAIVALIVALELALDAPLQDSFGAITEALGATLIDLNSEWLAVILAPVNSIAGLLGIGLLGLHFLYRKLFY